MRRVRQIRRSRPSGSGPSTKISWRRRRRRRGTRAGARARGRARCSRGRRGKRRSTRRSGGGTPRSRRSSSSSTRRRGRTGCRPSSKREVADAARAAGGDGGGGGEQLGGRGARGGDRLDHLEGVDGLGDGLVHEPEPAARQPEAEGRGESCSAQFNNPTEPIARGTKLCSFRAHARFCPPGNPGGRDVAHPRRGSLINWSPHCFTHPPLSRHRHAHPPRPLHEALRHLRARSASASRLRLREFFDRRLRERARPSPRCCAPPRRCGGAQRVGRRAEPLLLARPPSAPRAAPEGEVDVRRRGSRRRVELEEFAQRPRGRVVRRTPSPASPSSSVQPAQRALHLMPAEAACPTRAMAEDRARYSPPCAHRRRPRRQIRSSAAGCGQAAHQSTRRSTSLSSTYKRVHTSKVLRRPSEAGGHGGGLCAAAGDGGVGAATAHRGCVLDVARRAAARSPAARERRSPAAESFPTAAQLRRRRRVLREAVGWRRLGRAPPIPPQRRRCAHLRAAERPSAWREASRRSLPAEQRLSVSDGGCPAVAPRSAQRVGDRRRSRRRA